MEALTQKSAVQLLKEEFKEARDYLIQERQLTFSGFFLIVSTANKTYDSPDGIQRVRNTWYGNAADLHLTRFIRKEVKNLKNQ